MHTNQVVIQRTIQLILLINIFFLTSIHCISMANPLIKIDKGAKNHQHYTAHTTSSKKSLRDHLIATILTISTPKLLMPNQDLDNLDLNNQKY